MIYQENGKLYRRCDRELLCIEGWGNGLRVRSTTTGRIRDLNYGLHGEKKETAARISIDGEYAEIANGEITCKILSTGKLRFFNAEGKMILEEYDRNRFRRNNEGFSSALELDPRMYHAIRGTDNVALTVRFEAQDEKLYGMGQYQQPNLDLKGCIIELAQRNSQVSVPFVLSSAGYGLFWNNPGVGKVMFGANLTEWHMESTKQMDYWICAGNTPAGIEEQYADVVGKAPEMPAYGTGFWQCKLRYQTQEELLSVAREYKRRGLPVSVIVIDYFHWPHQGDWCFDPEYFPDPEAMVKELHEMGMELMVSVWPTVEEGSVNYEEIRDRGYLAATEEGNRLSHLGRTAFVDMTNPDARAYVWNKLKENYSKYGIRVFWLDEAEPEYTRYEYDNYHYEAGADLEVGNLYPREYSRMACEGMKQDGEKEVMNLVRSAWAGSQRYGALVWSGDIDSSFLSLRNQFAAGLNIGMAGIPWWTTDIGGFHGGNIHDPAFVECLIRWFEYGTFCPVMRLHGCREPMLEPLGETGGGSCPSGAANEVWSYGEAACEIMSRYIRFRESIRGYVAKTAEEAHQKGTPMIRTLFYQFPEDPETWKVEDEFFLGENLLVCPVLYAEERSRTVYLPEGSRWIRVKITEEGTKRGEVLEGGKRMEENAPLDVIPVYVKEDKWEEVFGQKA